MVSPLTLARRLGVSRKPEARLTRPKTLDRDNVDTLDIARVADFGRIGLLAGKIFILSTLVATGYYSDGRDGTSARRLEGIEQDLLPITV